MARNSRHLPIESRTRELGQTLYARVRSYRRSWVERIQDALMLTIMEDSEARSRLLRLVDVLAGLPPAHFTSRAAGLVREYTGEGMGGLPFALRAPLRMAASRWMPSLVTSQLAKAATTFVASRFIVDPDSSALERVLARLEREGRYPSFDLVGEAVLSDQEAQTYRRRYVDLLSHLGDHHLASRRTSGNAPALEVSLKLSSLTSQFRPEDPDGTLQRVRPALEEIFETARRSGIGVTIDAEQYALRDLTWHVARATLAAGERFGDWTDAGIVVQAYHRDVEAHARDVAAFVAERGAPMRVRLVKGAYWDHEVIWAEQNGWPVPVYQDKGSTDIAYETAARVLLSEAPGISLAVASHNLRTHAYVEAVRESLGLPESAVEHQTLYRTSESVSRALADVGWVSRDYVPTGDVNPGMAYLVRRILENTSQVGVLTKARFREDVGELLRPPAHGPESAAYRREAHASGFVNTPTARWFDEAERGAFRRALDDARANWGATYPLRIGDEQIETGIVVESLSPSHPDPGHPVGYVHQAGIAEAERAIAVANAGAARWAAIPLLERARIGRGAAELLRDRKMETAAWVVHEGGRTWTEAIADVEEAIDHIEWSARMLAHLASRIGEHRRPWGVVACIPPWNFPVALPAGMVSAALMAGNAVILKSAEATPIVADALTDVFHEAGVPREALVHLPGSGESIGELLVDSADVDHVAFTGSREVGLRINRRVADVRLRKGGVKRATLEMGGKNAIIVFADADLDEAVEGILTSAFSHAGQKCSACSRVLVHRDIYPMLRARLVEASRSLPMGPADDPGTFVNPVITKDARDRIAGFVRVAREEAAVLLDRSGEYENGEAQIVGPVLVELDAKHAPEASVAQEEVFGPVLPLIPFDSEDEAVALLNGTRYGLTLGVFSRSPDTVARTSRAGLAGNIYVNRPITGARVGIEPFGGLKLSGTGPKAGSEDYLFAFLTRKGSFRADSPPARATDAPKAQDTPVRRWHDASLADRVTCLERAASRLTRNQPQLEEAMPPLAGGNAAAMVQRMLATISAVIATTAEIGSDQRTVHIPGQTNHVNWDLPRGAGIAAVDDGAPPESLAGLIFGPLAAGNGLVVSASPGYGPLAELLVEALLVSGVPEIALAQAPGESLLPLAAGPLQFAATDLGVSATRQLHGVLAVTHESEGQDWVKALISVADGLAPGEPGFLRQFALPRTVAVRTLRHGAQLDLPSADGRDHPAPEPDRSASL